MELLWLWRGEDPPTPPPTAALGLRVTAKLTHSIASLRSAPAQDPNLSRLQMKLRSVRFAGQFGMGIGIAFG